MTFELWILAGAILWGIVHISLDSFTYKAQVGNAYTVTAQDDNIPRSKMSGRMRRANQNYTENFVLFAAAILIVQISGQNSIYSHSGAALWMAMRILYLPAYALGIPWTRTIIWQLSMIGLLMVLFSLLGVPT